RLDRDDLLALERERERIAAAARPDVEHGVGSLHEPAQDLQDRVVLAARVGPEDGGERRIEVGVGLPLAYALGLLAVLSHAPRPLGERLFGGWSQNTWHVRSLPPSPVAASVVLASRGMLRSIYP